MRFYLSRAAVPFQSCGISVDMSDNCWSQFGFIRRNALRAKSLLSVSRMSPLKMLRCFSWDRLYCSVLARNQRKLSAVAFEQFSELEWGLCLS